MGRFSQSGRLRQSGRPKDRLRAYLERGYRGRPTALARDAEISLKAAENALAGCWPGDLTFAAIVRRFGADIWQAVFAPEIEPVLARLDQEERELQERLREVAERRRQAAGDGQGMAPSPVTHEGKSFRP